MLELVLFAFLCSLVIWFIAHINARHCNLSEEERAENRKVAAEFFGEE